MNIQPGSAIALANATTLADLCGTCECDIPNIDAAFIRDCESNAPYQPTAYCSPECMQVAEEKAYEAVYTNWPNNCTCNGDFCRECLERRRRERE